MTLTVELYDGPPGPWDALVRAGSSWTHFHLHAWKPLIERVFAHECPYLAARGEDGGLVGVLPLVHVRSALFGRYLISMPFLNYGGPLGSPEAIMALTARARELAHARGVKLLELRSREELPIDLPVSHRKITVVLDLDPAGSEKVFNGFKGKLRSQIRRPEKEGVTVRFGADQVAPFYAVFSRHMRDLGTPVLSRALFEEIARVFQGDAWFGCAWKDNVPIACGCGFVFNGEFEITWASALREYNAISPNMALYWAFIERASQAGLAMFNFGRCTPGSATHKFKLQWGSRDMPLFWYQDSAGTAATPSPDEGPYALATKAWMRLPLPIANLIGPRIVRGIP